MAPKDVSALNHLAADSARYLNHDPENRTGSEIFGNGKFSIRRILCKRPGTCICFLGMSLGIFEDVWGITQLKEPKRWRSFEEGLDLGHRYRRIHLRQRQFIAGEGICLTTLHQYPRRAKAANQRAVDVDEERRPSGLGVDGVEFWLPRTVATKDFAARAAVERGEEFPHGAKDRTRTMGGSDDWSGREVGGRISLQSRGRHVLQLFVSNGHNDLAAARRYPVYFFAVSNCPKALNCAPPGTRCCHC